MPRIRWWMIALCFLANAVSYIDRANLAIAAPAIRAELGLDAAAMGLVLSAFFWTYAVMQLPAGWFIDRVGVRVSLTLAVAWWSAFTMATGLARGVTHFIAARLMLGVGLQVMAIGLILRARIAWAFSLLLLVLTGTFALWQAHGHFGMAIYTLVLVFYFVMALMLGRLMQAAERRVPGATAAGGGR